MPFLSGRCHPPCERAVGVESTKSPVSAGSIASRAPAPALRAEPALRRCGDRDPAACFLPQRHLHLACAQPECLRDIVPDPDRQPLTEVALVAEAVQVELQRLGLEAEILRAVLDRGFVEIGLAGDRTDRGELVARQRHLGDAGVRERLQARVVFRARMTESDELGRASAVVHHRNCTRWYETRSPASIGIPFVFGAGRGSVCPRPMSSATLDGLTFEAKPEPRGPWR